MDINKLMQQANKLKAELEQKEKEFDQKLFTFEKQGVKLVMSGNLEVKELIINEALIDPSDAETLQDMIIIVVNEANAEIIRMKKQLGENVAKGIL